MVSNGTGLPVAVPGYSGMGQNVLVPVSFCPGTKKICFLLSLCPRTRTGEKIPGQTPLSRDVPGRNHYLFGKRIVKKLSKKVKNFLFFSKIMIFFLSWTTCQNRSLSCPLARFWGCPFVPGQFRDVCPGVPLFRDSSGMSVPVSRRTRKSCPVGNPMVEPGYIYSIFFKCN